MYRIWYTIIGVSIINEVEWNKETLKEIASFPDEVKRDIGYLIFKLQIGERLEMPSSRPMPSLGKGCYELRSKGIDGIYRIFYFVKIKGKVLIFHAFNKKTQKTPKKEIDLGKKNLKAML